MILAPLLFPVPSFISSFFPLTCSPYLPPEFPPFFLPLEGIFPAFNSQAPKLGVRKKDDMSFYLSFRTSESDVKLLLFYIHSMLTLILKNNSKECSIYL